MAHRNIQKLRWWSDQNFCIQKSGILKLWFNNRQMRTNNLLGALLLYYNNIMSMPNMNIHVHCPTINTHAFETMPKIKRNKTSFLGIHSAWFSAEYDVTDTRYCLQNWWNSPQKSFFELHKWQMITSVACQCYNWHFLFWIDRSININEKVLQHGDNNLLNVMVFWRCCFDFNVQRIETSFLMHFNH